jgi:biotin operon repressor
MKNRLERMKLMVDKIQENGSFMSQSELCAKLDISRITLRRYIDSLKAWGFEVESKKGHVRILKAGTLSDHTIFSKSSYISFKILMYIYNNAPCSRARLKDFFCGPWKEPIDSKMTVRNLDIYIKNLVELGYIEKYFVNNGLFYRTAQGVIQTDLLSFESLINLYIYLNINKNVLPFKDEVDDIREKIGSVLINHIRRSRDAFEDLKLAYEVFPNCVGTSSSTRVEAMAEKLEKYCHNADILEIIMESGSRLRVYPFFVVFNSNADCWYLACKLSPRDENNELIKLDNIKLVKPTGEKHNIAIEQIDREKNEAYRQLQESFSINIEEPTLVEVVFKGGEEAVNAARQRLLNEEGTIVTLEDGELYFNGRIHGRSDFFAWLRRFGSNAVILGPEELIKSHMHSVKRALEAYGEL